MSFVEGKLENARVYDGKVFPRTYLPSDETKRTPTDLAESIADERRSLLTSLDKHGALLFRGFGVNSVSDFTGIVEAFGWEEHPYEGASNRVKVADRVFTASEAPLNEFIPFHHEMAMIKSSCSKIFFMCMTPASFGGETSIVRSDVVVEEMEKAEPEAVAKFNEVGMIANIHAKITTKSGNDDSTAGRKLWHRMLKTTDEEEGRKFALEKLACNSVAFNEDGTADFYYGPRNPMRELNGRKVWFWTILGYSMDERDASATYGDGSPIPEKVKDSIDRILEDHSVDVCWEKGDVLVVDNFRCQHARRPGKPPRSVLVSVCK